MIEYYAHLEWLAVGLNLAFLFLLMKEKSICWLFGILGSLLSIYLFVVAKLYSEAILYSYYVLAGFYGWYRWSRAGGSARIHVWRLKQHGIAGSIGAGLALLLGYAMDQYTDAAQPYFDAFTTIFSFLATYMEANKVLSAWSYWVIINFFSIYLYHSRGLDVYAIQMAIFGVVSILGLREWMLRYRAQSS